MRDLLAFLGAMYGAVVGATAGRAVLVGSGLRFGVVGTSGLALMGFGIAAYSFYKFARDD